MSVGLGVAASVGLGVAASIGLGVAAGVALGVALGVSGGVAGGVSASATGGSLGGLGFGLGFGLEVGFGFGCGFPGAFMLTYFRLATYPIDALLSWLTYRAALSRPLDSFRWWRRCPVAWNQVIYLPLPGAARLLALATGQNRVAGFQQIAFVAAERPLQRRLVREALIEVAFADLDADSAATLATVPDRLGWTNQAPLTLPEEFASALSRFARVAWHTAQFLEVASPYRKAEILKLAREEIESLQKEFIAVPGGHAPRLLQVANRWREILDGEQAGLKQLAAERREIPNPFVFGNPVDERNTSAFAGRRDVARQIEESLLGARHSPALLLHGPRRMGKSSILKQLPRLLGPDFSPAWLDCQNPAIAGAEATTASLLHHLSKALCEGLQRRRVTIKPLTADDLTRGPFGAFDAWLTRVEQAMPTRMRALLCLDEYERLQRALDDGWGGDFLDHLRHTMQHRPRFGLVFTGARTFAEMGPAWTDRFISARRVRVGFLEPDDVRPLLTKPIPDFDAAYEPGAVEAIITATRCQPYLVQAVAFELVQCLNEQSCKLATLTDAETAITRALESGGEYFANVWSDAGIEGQRILKAIALPGSVGDSMAGSRDNHRERPASTPAGAMRWLRDHDVLDDAGRFAVPMVERWVRENAG